MLHKPIASWSDDILDINGCKVQLGRDSGYSRPQTGVNWGARTRLRAICPPHEYFMFVSISYGL